MSEAAWHHIAVTYNGTDFENTLYFDGVQVDTRRLTGGPSYGPSESSWIGKATSNGNNLRFGTDDQLPSRTFNGLLDDIRIYDHELSASEVAALVPEPTSYLLTLVGIGMVLAARRRRKS